LEVEGRILIGELFKEQCVDKCLMGTLYQLFQLYHSLKKKPQEKCTILWWLKKLTKFLFS